jgi:hypothetical protein
MTLLISWTSPGTDNEIILFIDMNDISSSYIHMFWTINDLYVLKSESLTKKSLK